MKRITPFIVPCIRDSSGKPALRGVLCWTDLERIARSDAKIIISTIDMEPKMAHPANHCIFIL